MTTTTRWIHALIAAAVLMTVAGCANSVLRNAAEAGLDTVTDRPTPTPSAR